MYRNFPATPTTPRPRDEQRRAVREQLAVIETVLSDSGCTLTTAEIERWVAATRDEGER
jgi:hypothetical protein